MKHLIFISVFLVSQTLVNAQNKTQDAKSGYLTIFIEAIDKAFSELKESETKKKLKRECIYLISDIDQLQIEAELLLEMFTSNTIGYWLYDNRKYSEQLEIIYYKNRSINDRLERISFRYDIYLENIQFILVEKMESRLQSRDISMNVLRPLLKGEELDESNKDEILRKVNFIYEEAQSIFEEARRFRSQILEKY